MKKSRLQAGGILFGVVLVAWADVARAEETFSLDPLLSCDVIELRPNPNPNNHRRIEYRPYVPSVTLYETYKDADGKPQERVQPLLDTNIACGQDLGRSLAGMCPMATFIPPTPKDEYWGRFYTDWDCKDFDPRRGGIQGHVSISLRQPVSIFRCMMPSDAGPYAYELYLSSCKKIRALE